MPKFNGHKNWNHWNVSLWINNDQQLYCMAREYRRDYAAPVAAALMHHRLTVLEGENKTPDGAPYSVSSIRAAMSGM